MNILITSVSRKVSLVKAFRQALAREGGGKVIAVDAGSFASALYFADEQYILPPSGSSGFIDKVLELCRLREIKLIVPTRDEELLLFTRNKERFLDAGVFVLAPSAPVVDICQDKNLFIQFCRENNFSTPRTYDINGQPDRLEFPLFVKPAHGKGSKGARRVDSKEELALFLKSEPSLIAQELITAPEYTVDLFADFSGKVVSVIPRRRILVFGGESFISRTEKNAAIIKECVRISQTLTLIGHNTIQCFFSGNSVKFIEINPRFGGGASLGFAAGAPSPLFLIKLLKGEELRPMIGEFKDNYLMLRYTDDLFLDENSLIKE